MRHLLKRLAARLQPILQSDSAFIEAAYIEILGRPADQDGVNHYVRLLRQGLGRTAVLLSLMRSDEFQAKLTKVTHTAVSIMAIRPGQYRSSVDRSNGEAITVFDAQSPEDFDWLERMILEHGYYEQPGVWNLGVDTDKRVIAEMIASFSPARPLELGCAAGAVLDCLSELGVNAEGVEISAMALGRASIRVRDRIHHGDVLSLDLPLAYDMVFGLDIFEHLNPNRIDEYVARLAAITVPGAYLFCNIPAFGEDPMFGSVFPLYVDEWATEAAAGRPFSTLHVDELGYPLHGHLIWADAAWWAARFEAGGFRRELDIERELHRKYDRYMEKRSAARKAFFVFSKDAAPGRSEQLAARIRTDASRVLA